jgi:hypothetical protein
MFAIDIIIIIIIIFIIFSESITIIDFFGWYKNDIKIKHLSILNKILGIIKYG